MYVDVTDTFFKYVKSRIIATNNNRKVVGMIEANAWPPAQVDDEAFYAILMGETPQKGFGSVSSRGQIHLIQWTWVIIGVDLPQNNQIGRNRGNRYRNNALMKQELINGLFPGFCLKNTYSAQQQGNTLVSVPTATGDNIWWSAPTFIPSKMQDKSGVLYGAAQVRVCEFGDLITS